MFCVHSKNIYIISKKFAGIFRILFVNVVIYILFGFYLKYGFEI